MAARQTQESPLDIGEIPLVDTMIRWIREKGLETPATFFLEIHRPLMPLAHTAAMLAGPVAAAFVGPDYYERVEALRDPSVLDQVLARLAGRDDRPEIQEKAKKQ